MTAATSATQVIHFRPGTVDLTVEYNPDAWRRPRRWLRSLFDHPRPVHRLHPRRATVVRTRA